MDSTKYIGMDVHKESISIAVMNSAGKIVMECVIETKAITILQFVEGLRGDLHVTFEEGTSAAWLYDLLKPHVTKVVVCDPRKNASMKEGNKSDKIDARRLAELLRLNDLNPVYHGEHGLRTLKELVRSYLTVTKDVVRVMTRVKAIYRSWAIPCSGKQVYAARHRGEWLAKIHHPGVRRRAEFYYEQLDGLRVLRQRVRRELLAESKKHEAWKRLCQIPSIGPIRAAVLLGILQTPHRFRTKRQLWTYSGLGIERHSSADHRSVDGHLQRCNKHILVRGLNRNCNHDLKDLFRGRPSLGQASRGPSNSLRRSSCQRHEARNGTPDVSKKDCHDRTDRMEERSVLQRQSSETPNSLSVSDRVRTIVGNFSGGGRRVLETLWFESESQRSS